MCHNTPGDMVMQAWKSLPQRFPTVDIDEFVVMSNHVHGILMLGQSIEECNESTRDALCQSGESNSASATTRAAPTLADVIGAFKSVTTVEYTRGVRIHQWPKFPARLWQRNYYEHVIRNEHELDVAREYISNNPLKWALDRENPINS